MTKVYLRGILFLLNFKTPINMLQCAFVSAPTSIFLYVHTKEIKCLSCGEKVTVKMAPFADGYAATCPKCGNLAYLGK